jgi:hypothetical protein
MKKIIGAGKAMTVSLLMLFIIYLAFTHPSNWQTTAIVALVLAIVVQLFYKVLHTINFGKGYAIVFGDGSSRSAENVDLRQDKVDKLNQRISKTEAKNRHLQDQINGINKQLITINKEVSRKSEITIHKLTISETLQNFYRINDLENFNKTKTPVDVKNFHNTLEEAKRNNESFKHDYYYKRIVDKYSEAFAYSLIKKISSICDTDTLQKVEQTLYKAVKRPYSNAAILAIRDELTKADNKAELTLEFEHFLKELDMLY